MKRSPRQTGQTPNAERCDLGDLRCSCGLNSSSREVIPVRGLIVENGLNELGVEPLLQSDVPSHIAGLQVPGSPPRE